MSGQENETLQAETGQQDQQEKAVNDAATAEVQDTPEVEGEAAAADEIETLRSELDKEREQAKTNMDLALRAQAEMENLRKRTTRDIENAHKYALEKFVNELLPIVDSLELGMSAAEGKDDNKELLEGMQLTLKMFLSALEKFGVKQIAPEGEKFNPEQHEAVSMQEIEGKEAGTVVTVMQKGYELNGRLVRPAMVMVAK
ncbi:MAG: nucleotide exchange factor GrpE [Gammaproteobacteria bacterium]